MINIYRKNSFNGNEIILDNESFFNNNISARILSDVGVQVIRDIDKAILLDRRTGKIETPYGIAGIRDLSTGCKTVLNYLFIKEHPEKYPTVKAINATECGWNALNSLFRILENRNDSKTIIVIEHDNDLYKCDERDYCIDGEETVTSLFNF